ncbi:hypothetical protein O181_088507 [Austropuccinia psidii MF-1]|uniref:Integrase catalytic domain-containing protein n=1 Tax=Austropuccinia psidii MF-1 TaxID=1389203 RepID=A0A9Q3IRR9_9BASI|nr:hypothetical protein [Austropuccinia psidii MF-1]
MQDAKLYRARPAKQMGYTAGKSSISIVMVENQEAKVNMDTGMKFGTMIQIQEPIYACEIAHMDWVKVFPLGGDRSYNEFLVLVDTYRKTPIFLPFQKHVTAMDTVIMIWNKVISHIGLFQNIISDRDLKLTSALRTNLHNLFGTKLSF